MMEFKFFGINWDFGIPVFFLIVFWFIFLALGWILIITLSVNGKPWWALLVFLLNVVGVATYKDLAQLAKELQERNL